MKLNVLKLIFVLFYFHSFKNKSDYKQQTTVIEYRLYYLIHFRVSLFRRNKDICILVNVTSSHYDNHHCDLVTNITSLNYTFSHNATRYLNIKICTFNKIIEAFQLLFTKKKDVTWQLLPEPSRISLVSMFVQKINV